MSKFDEILNSSDASDALLGEQIDKKLDKDGWIVDNRVFKSTAANTLQYTGLSITVPLNKTVLVCVENRYSSYAPVKTVLSISSTTGTGRQVVAEGTAFCSAIFSPTYDDNVLHVWVSHADAGDNSVITKYKFI